MDVAYSCIQTIPGIGLHIVTPLVSATEGWWLAGGIDPADCVAAYQAKGAASYAASKVNLTNPGTYDLSEGNGAVPWNPVNGWQFVSANGQYFSTGIVPSSDLSTSVIVYATDNVGVVFSGWLGCRDDVDTEFILSPVYVGFKRGYKRGTAARSGSASNASGSLAITGDKGYYNGVEDATGLNAPTGGFTRSLMIGYSGNGIYPTVNEKAVAIYSSEVTPDQILAVHTAMAAL